MNDWNAEQYMKFEKERTQPSVDLIGRLDFSPKSILDIGCGPGNSTAMLKDRFSYAEILGIDSSDNMLERARNSYPDSKFKKCLVPDGLDQLGNYDLIFSNACLHWIPEHKTLLPRLIEKLNDGGRIAVQMPLVQYAPFYKTLDSLVAEKWQKLSKIKNFHNLLPDETYDILSSVSQNITMWETVYYHIVPSYGGVIGWYRGSGLRPYLDALNEDEKSEFLSDLLGAIKEKYHTAPDNSVILKMPRMFFIAEKNR